MNKLRPTRTIECADCGAKLDAENDEELVDVVGRHYVDAHRAIRMTEDRIRREIAARAHDV